MEITEINDRKERKDIKSLLPEELRECLGQMGESSFRAGQIYGWLHQKRVLSFDEMTNLSLSLRSRLKEEFTIPQLEIVKCQISELDGTRKYAFALDDGNIIESVFMPYHYGNSVCVSSQAGCRMGCRFCASTLDGLARNLQASEILEQVYAISRDTGQRISHVVIMGSGEPLDNLEQVVRFIRILSDEKGGGISQRNITLSTCGLVPGIHALAKEHLQVTLVMSLHAPNDALRQTMMPIANRYSIRECLDACSEYFKITGRRISYEYSLVRGVNDRPQEADELAQILKGRQAHVNLIPINPIQERDYREPVAANVANFKKRLEKSGINVTIRRRMGADIDSACGQLRRKVVQEHHREERGT